MLAAEEDAVGVCAEDVAPAVEVGVLGVVRGRRRSGSGVVSSGWVVGVEAGDAGVVDEDVKGAVAVEDEASDAAPVVFEADVESVKVCVRTEAFGFGGAELVADVGEVHGRAFAMEGAGDGESDAAGGAGEESDFADEAASWVGLAGCGHFFFLLLEK
mgnify:CR=1 FL=1